MIESRDRLASFRWRCPDCASIGMWVSSEEGAERAFKHHVQYSARHAAALMEQQTGRRAHANRPTQR